MESVIKEPIVTNMDFTVSILSFLKNENTGIRIICDVTAELFNQVEPEFLATLKSIREAK